MTRMDSENAPGEHWIIRLEKNPDVVVAAANGRVVIQWITQEPHQRWICNDPAQPPFHPICEGGGGGYAGTIQVKDGSLLLLRAPFYSWVVDTRSGHQRIAYFSDTKHLYWSVTGDHLEMGAHMLLKDVPGELSNFRIEKYGTIPQPTTRDCVLSCGSQSSLYADGDRFTIFPTGFPVQDIHFKFEEIAWSTGFAYRSKHTGKYLGYAGEGQQLVAYDHMCPEAIWTHEKAEHPFEIWNYMHPWLHPNLSLDIIGPDMPKDNSNLTILPTNHGRPAQLWYLSY